jgi:hypothetical protein
MALAALALLVTGTGARAAEEFARTPAPFAVLEPLIGEWDVGPESGGTSFVERFSWGPNRGYMRFSASLITKSGEEHLHLDGVILWNATTRRFDYLLAVEPGSLTQERGEFYRNEAGEIIREVFLTAADGSTGVFRQTFRPLEGGKYAVSLLRQTGENWTATFPGSDRLLMVPRAG